MSSNETSVFSERVRDIAKRKGITREKLAEKTCIGLSTINTYLRKRKPVTPTLINATLIAEALEVSLDYLSGVGEEKEIHSQKNISAEILLKNLFTATKNASLKICFEGEKTIFSSENKFIKFFFEQIGNEKDYDKINRVVSNFANLKVWDNILVDETTYYYYEGLKYAHSNISDEERNLYPEECNEEIERRKIIWNTSTSKEKDELIRKIQGK